MATVLNIAKDSTQGVQLDFTDLTYTITKRNESKDILKNVSGRCKPGSMLAIMGRSGAGKTTLLDILAGNISQQGCISGRVLVDGSPRNAAQFQKISCYVMQKDVLLPSATVRESLLTSALLRLPYTMPHSEKVQRVDAIIEELGLQSCQHVLIGEEALGKKGISGGQRRRVSMGIEMVTNPTAIFLDEPTSGLDSDSAYSIVKAIKELSRHQRTVVFTIHQPSSDIVEQFDDFMLLAAGRCCYLGPWGNAVSVVGSFGYPCPSFKNPADFFMNITKDDEVSAKLAGSFDRYAQEQSMSSPDSYQHLPRLMTSTMGSSDTHPAADTTGSTAGDKLSLSAETAPSASRTSGLKGSGIPSSLSHLLCETTSASTPAWYQVYVLSQRFALSWWRDPMLFSSEAFQYLVFGTFIGLMYLQVSDSTTKGAFQRASAIWFTLTAMSFTPAMTAMVSWERERLLLRRESAMKAYSSAAFFVAKTLVTWPIELALAAVLGAIVYFMVGFQVVASKFFAWLFVLLMFQVTSETIGVICAAVTPSAAYANLVLSVVMIFMLSFTGFLTQGTPIYFKWVQSISYLNYAYISMLDVEFSGLKLVTPEGERVDARLYIPEGSTNKLSLTSNIMIVFALMVGVRLLALVLLRVAIHRRWL